MLGKNIWIALQRRLRTRRYLFWVGNGDKVSFPRIKENKNNIKISEGVS
jgi:hypothetical protein